MKDNWEEEDFLNKDSRDFTPEELEQLEDFELNICDECFIIESTYELVWIDSEEFYDDKVAQKLVQEGKCAVCKHCLELRRSEGK